MNSELVHTLLSVLGYCGVIMALITGACLVTPRLARWIEKKNPQLFQDPERVGDNNNSEENEVKGLYDKQELDDFDPNYKIYNTDIYGVDFKNGKKQKRKDG